MTDEYIDPYHIIQGETKTWSLTVTQLVSKAAQDLTGCQVHLTIRGRWDEPDPALVYKRTTNAGGASGEVVISAPTSGVAVVNLTPADTALLVPGATYVMDAWVITTSGEHRPVLREKTVSVGTRATRLAYP